MWFEVGYLGHTYELQYEAGIKSFCDEYEPLILFTVMNSRSRYPNQKSDIGRFAPQEVQTSED